MPTSKSEPVRINSPGAPTNPPEHLFSEDPANTGESQPGPSRPALGPADDTADPHPADEENYRRIRHPGGANPPAPGTDVGANPEVHNGADRPPPNNRRRDAG